MTIDADPHPDFATADELATAIRQPADLGELDDITPPTATGITLADIDARHTSYMMAAPNARQLPNPPPPEYLAWLEADRRLIDTRDRAHDGASDIRAAEARDRQNALNAARTGGKLPKPTAPAAAAAAVDAIRRYDAEVSLATEALNAVDPALRQVWPAWRRQLIDNVNATTERAQAALVAIEAALIDRAAAVQQLLVVDKMYGEGRPGEVVEHIPPPDAIPGTWQQPESQGVAVADLLERGPSLTANYAARTVPDLRDIRAMLAASTLNEQWSPTSDDDGPDDDDTLPPAA